MTAPAVFTAGQQVGRYHIRSLLGRGGMGEVWLAFDPQYDREVAIKTMTGEAAEDPAYRRRFLKEAAEAPRVVHPYVATVFEVIEHGGAPLIVMERVKGRRFDEAIRDAALPPEAIARHGVEIAEALAAIHEAGLIHRDIKPANIMLTDQGHVKVMDLGVAHRIPREVNSEDTTKSISLPVTRPGAIVGTIAYMSPEQICGEPLDARSDLFSLGVVLWEALTRIHPFQGTTVAETAAAILKSLPGNEERRQQVSATGVLGEAINRLLEKSPTDRFGSAVEVVEQLRVATSGGPHPVPPTLRRPPLWLMAVVPAVMVVILLGAFAVWRTAKPSPGPSGTLTLTAGARASVAVLPLEDRTEHASDGLMGRMVADLLGASLGETAQFRAVGFDRVLGAIEAQAVGRSNQVARVRKVLSPDWTIAGSLYREEGELVAAIDIYRGADLKPERTFQARGRRASDLVMHAAASVREMSGVVSAAGFANVRPAPRFATVDEAALLFRDATDLTHKSEYGKAIERLRRALAIDPDFIDGHVLMADLLMGVGLEREARDTIQKGRRLVESAGLDPDSRQALKAAAVEGRLSGSVLALTSLQRLAVLYPDESEVLFALSQDLVSAGKQDEALEALQRLTELDPLDLRAQRYRGEILIGKQKYAEARAALDDAESGYVTLGLSAGVAGVTETRAYLEYATGKYSEARRLYQRAGVQFREAGLASRALTDDQSAADMSNKMWRMGEAETEYRAVLKGLKAAGHYRQIVDTLSGLGGLLLRSGKVEEADRVLMEAADEARKLGSVALTIGPLINRAWVMAYTGRVKEARRLATDAIEIARSAYQNGMVSSARIVIAAAARQEGQLEEASRLFKDEAALMLKDGNESRRAFALGWLAEVQEDADRPSEALRSVDEALTLMANQGPTVEKAYRYGCRARLFSLLGRQQEAAADLALAVAVSRQQADVAQVHHMLSRTRLALALEGGKVDEVRSVLAQHNEFSDRGTLYRGAAAALRAEAMHRAGDFAGALAHALGETTHPWSSAASRALAGLTCAESLERLGRRSEAAAAARSALTAARGMDSPLTIARAAASILRNEPGCSDAPEIRSEGRSQMKRFLEFVPAGNRDSVLLRADVASIISTIRAGE